MKNYVHKTNDTKKGKKKKKKKEKEKILKKIFAAIAHIPAK